MEIELISALTEGRKVEELRKAKGLTRGQLATYAGFSVEFVGKVERGERSLTDKSRAAFAQVLGTTTTELLKARGAVNSEDVVEADLHQAIKKLPLGDILTIKYGKRGAEMAEGIRILLEGQEVELGKGMEH